ncbi:MAG: hypothetical protein QG596_1108 [Actinomycetota bacterium]|jgi:RNA polymerase sigma-70 factor (ECF subfamily)|nr:hypothetical protein [Actinomycetota bacterium]
MRLIGQSADVRANRAPLSTDLGPDGNGFREAFEQNYDLIFRYLRRRVNEQLAADLTAETFATALREFRQFDPDRGNVRAWLFGIATNQMRREVRREKRELRAYARSGVDPIAADPMLDADQRVDAQELQRALARGLASLAEDDRDALLLLSWGELSYLEIAEAQGVPVGTVKSRISRARRHLRGSLGQTDPIPDSKNAEEATGG